MVDPELESGGPTGPSLDAGSSLAQALASRICHDLVSPVGAVANGVELLRDVGNAAASAEIDMIDQSAQRASALLKLHRLAFGANSGESNDVARPVLARVLADGLGSHRVSVDTAPLDGPPLGQPIARTVGLAGLCGLAMLGMRGRIEIALGAQEALPATVTAHGADAERKAGLLDLLGETLEGPPIDPRQIEFRLLPAAAAFAGASLVHHLSSQSAVFQLTTL